MEDQKIIDLYYERNEQAIEESNRKYGSYCHTIAWNVLSSRESAEECVNDTWWHSWKVMPPQLPNGYGIPFYTFYKKIRQDEDGFVQYAKTMVPAIEVSGLEEYFYAQMETHREPIVIPTE